MTYDEVLAIYDDVVTAHKEVERKGKTMPYTSANGYMFTLVNKEGELGMRFAKEDCKKLMEKYDTTDFKSHRATMRDYIKISEDMLSDKKLLKRLLDKSYKYVLTLPPK